MSKRVFAALMLAAVLASTGDGRAQSPQRDIATDLVVGDVATNDDPYGGWIGVRVRLAPGWKIYWKAPGDTGLPPEFDWSASSNLAVADVQWPTPHRTSILGVESIGYTGEVLFPVKLQTIDPDLDTRIELKLALYACSTICVREERILKADLSNPSGPEAQALIDEWREHVPAEKSASLAIASLELVRSTPPRLRVEATSVLPLEHPDLFVASMPAGVYAGRPEVEIAGDRTILTAVLEADPAGDGSPVSLTITVADGGRAVETVMPPAVFPTSDGDRAASASALRDDPPLWWSIIATAWLGGLVLNLMPCVFPVLSLKLLSFVGGPRDGHGELRANLMASAAGIIASFLALASTLAAIKAFGGTIGWGIQFQHPVFLGTMAILIALFAANVLGLLEVSLPTGLTTALAGRGMPSSAPSHFAAGFVATLLATPCSAPFVGTAVGFALSRNTADIYGVFAALGIGMATPYLAIAGMPRLAAWLPRPGRWMLWLRRAMAVPMLATSAWLITLLDATAGHVAAAFLTTTVAIGLAALAWRHTEPLARATVAVSSVLAIAAVGVVLAVARATDASDAAMHDIRWHPFGELDGLVRSGHTVFLDITADWCVTCKVNKALVVNNPAIVRRLSADVVPVRADWTRPDPVIAAYLKSHGRYGLPFNAVFGPDTPDGLVLPELLTTDAVLGAFARSSAGTPPSIETK